MKTITAECSNCESTYDIIYEEPLVSQDYPEICPFCGEQIDELTESDYIEDDDAMDNQEWDD